MNTLHSTEESYSWSAFDKNKCDHYYFNGQQMRFFRTMPDSVSGDFERKELSVEAVKWMLKIFVVAVLIAGVVVL